MFTFLSIVYVFVCLFLILVVLLQSGKGGGMGAAFGGGASREVFGGAGAGNILTRLTAVGAALFMVLSATLAYMSSSNPKADALDEASREIQAKEEARSGGSGSTEDPEPAGMSAPGEGGGDQGGSADQGGSGDQGGSAEAGGDTGGSGAAKGGSGADDK
jgi:preprotein translocase subunit SecG